MRDFSRNVFGEFPDSLQNMVTWVKTREEERRLAVKRLILGLVFAILWPFLRYKTTVPLLSVSSFGAFPVSPKL